MATAVRTGSSSWNLVQDDGTIEKFTFPPADTGDKTVSDLQAVLAIVQAQTYTPPVIVDATEIFADSFGRPFTKQSLAKLVLEGTALVTNPPAYRDHFSFGSAESGEVGELGWSFTNGTVAYANPSADRPGVMTRASSAVSGEVSSLYPLDAPSTEMLIKSDLQEMSWAFLQPGVAATYRIGICSDASANPPSDGFYLEHLPADTNWFSVRRRAGVETRTDTGIAFANSWIDYRLRRVSTDNWEVFLNDGAFQVIHTIGNIPLETTLLLPFSQIIPNSNAVRYLHHDFFSMVTK